MIGGLALVVLLGVGGSVGWSWMQANTMRSKVYRPLYQEVTAVEEVVRASSISRAVPSTTFMSLKKDPLWDQVPEDLRKNVQDTYEKAWDCQSEMVVVRSHYAGMAARAVRMVRKEQDDQAWVRSHPKPAGPQWRMQDWIEFPQNVAALEREWGEDEFLYLGDLHDRWEYRITRDDLRRARLTLEQFLANLNQSIENFGRIQAYRQHCRAAISMVATLRKQLEEKAQ